MKINRLSIGIFLSVVGSVFLSDNVKSAVLTASEMIDGKWLASNQPFHVFIKEDQEKSEGRLVFFIDAYDVTAVVQQTGIEQYTYAANIFPLPSGAHTFTAYVVSDDNEWNQIGELSLQVLSKAGFEESELTPRLSLTEKSQFSSDATGDAFPVDPETYHEFSLTTGLNTRHSRNGWEIQSSWNVVGSSVEEEALRFGELQYDAPRMDLSDYLVEVRNSKSSLALGHVNFGNNPLLINGLANRGVVLNYQAFGSLYFSVTSQSGQQITGYNNFFGFRNVKNNSVQSGSVGYDFFDGESGKLRAELSYLTAEITSELDFNVGEVADSEKNKGYGLLLAGEAFNGRLRANIVLARSTYQNAEDPFLSQGFDLVPSLESSDSARTAHIDYDVLRQDVERVNNNRLTISLHYERIDPLYKTVSAFVNPDVEVNAIGVAGQLGQLSWQGEVRHSRDNLNDVESVLTTVTETNSLNFSLPLQALTETPKIWLPQSLSYSVQRVHQYGDNFPIDFDPDSHIPDQVNLIHNTNLNWQFGAYGVGYTLSWSNQDNRQQDRDQADFRDINHGINFSLPLTSKFIASLALGVVSAIDREQNLRRYNDSGSLNIDWKMNDKISLSSNYSIIKGGDSKNFSESDNTSFQSQINYQFELAMFGNKKLPGQLFLRYAFTNNYSIDNQFQFESDGRNQSVNGGFNLSWF